jgi:predicted ferric reductase
MWLFHLHLLLSGINFALRNRLKPIMMNKLNLFTFLIMVYSVVVCMTVKKNDEVNVAKVESRNDTLLSSNADFQHVQKYVNASAFMYIQATR